MKEIKEIEIGDETVVRTYEVITHEGSPYFERITSYDIRPEWNTHEYVYLLDGGEVIASSVEDLALRVAELICPSVTTISFNLGVEYATRGEK